MFLSASTTLNKKSAFALVIALMFLVFIFLLAISLASLLRVELQKSETIKIRHQAKLNAKFGLIKAIAQLQKSTGDDQVITTHGKLLENQSHNPNYTITWNVREGFDLSSYDILTSGYDIFRNNTGATISNTLDKKYTLLYSDSHNPELSIRAPNVEITDHEDKLCGSYSYWIADEGVKSRVNTLRNFTEQEKTNAIVPLVDNPQILKGLTKFPNYSAKTRKLFAWSNLKFLDKNLDKKVQPYFHDLTLHSYSLLTDVKNGGLKKDLTAAFTSDSEFEKLTNDVGLQLFPNQSANDKGGPRWSQVRSFFKQHESLDDNGNFRSVKQQTSSEVGHYPLITKFSLFLHATQVLDGATRKVRFHYIPHLVLWNPYNASLPAQDYFIRYNFGYGDWRGVLGFNYINYLATTTESGTIWNSIYNYGASGYVNPFGISDFYELQNQSAFILRVECPEIPSGEAIIFSPHVNSGIYHTELKHSITELKSGSYNTLSPGYRTGASFYLDSSSTVQANGTLQGKIFANDDEEITITMAKSPEELSSRPLLILDRLRHFGFQEDYLSKNISIQNFPGLNTPFVEGITPDSTFPARGVSSWMKFSNNFLQSNDLDGTRVCWIANFNPRAQLSGPSLYDEGYQAGVKHAFYDIPNWTSVSFEPSSVNSVFGDEQFDGNNAYVGYSDGPDVTSCILYNVFNSKSDFISIADLAHGYFHNFDEEGLNQLYAGNYSNLMPSTPIGNSLVPPHLTDSQVYNDEWPAAQSQLYYQNPSLMIYDYSYFLNNALLDRYFFSSYKYDNNQTIINRQSFANPKFMPIKRGSKMNGFSVSNYHQSAENIMIEGGFNINSASINAWISNLSALKGTYVKSSNGVSFQTTDTPFTKFHKTPESAFTSLDEPKALYSGFRALSDDEIQNLASAIVKVVKARGPFKSVADFINRDPYSNNPDYQRVGPLQQAINNAGINSVLDQDIFEKIDVSDFSDSKFDLYNREALSGTVSQNLAGYLDSSTLLQRLGSTWNVRSDTFRIRVHGSAIVSSGTKELTAVYCEAIVRRTVDKINPSQNESIYEVPQSSLGRKYEIISFRWLNM